MSVSAGAVHMDMNLKDNSFKNAIKDNANIAQKSMGSAFKSIGKMAVAAFAINKVVDFGRECLKVASETQSAWQGLSSIVTGQGRSFEEAKGFLQHYVKDGLVPLNDAVMAYKNLASRGYDDGQIKQVMESLKDAAAFGRQAGKTMGEAISSASEGLKNENSMLVDNAGVTKNVAKMWAEYAKSIGTTSNKLTQNQKIQAEVAGITAETKFQMGDAAIYADTFAGRSAKLSASMTTLKTGIGGILMTIANMFMPAIQWAINGVNTFVSAIVNLIKTITGKDIFAPIAKANTNMGSGFVDAAKDATDMGDKVAKAAKKAQRSLLNIDEINNISKPEKADGGGSAAGDAGNSASSLVSAVEEGSTALNKFTEKAMKLFDLFKDGFSIGFDGSNFNNILKHINGIKKSLKDVFLAPEVLNASNKYIEAVVFNLGKVSGSIRKCSEFLLLKILLEV